MALKFLQLLSRINWKNVLILALLLALAAAFAKLFLAVALLAAVVAVSAFVNYSGMRMFGIELVTFATVVMGIVYGPAVGAVMGLLFVIIQLVLSGYFGVYYLWVVPEYAVLGYVASSLAGGDIVAFGVQATLALQVFNLTMTYFFDRYSFFSHVIYSATNVAFNFVVFALFGQMLVGALA